mmetsp:Transcript_32056/g.61404  ORF Transcript_32056/g.61404 Transcript_32056/m.61404 type:complete len:175 (-) Transcript_32056:103-627(-)
MPPEVSVSEQEAKRATYNVGFSCARQWRNIYRRESKSPGTVAAKAAPINTTQAALSRPPPKKYSLTKKRITIPPQIAIPKNTTAMLLSPIAIDCEEEGEQTLKAVQFCETPSSGSEDRAKENNSRGTMTNHSNTKEWKSSVRKKIRVLAANQVKEVVPAIPKYICVYLDADTMD